MIKLTDYEEKMIVKMLEGVKPITKERLEELDVIDNPTERLNKQDKLNKHD